MQKRIVWIDVVKTLTMLLVILGHCTYLTIATSYGGIDYGSQITGDPCVATRALGVLTRFIYTFHMPLFMAMSGACLQLTKSKHLSFVDMVRNKWNRLIVPFILTSLLVSIPVKYVSGYWDDSSNIISDILLGQLLLMGNSHLWFVVALFWIFIEHRLLLKLNIRQKTPTVFVALLTISITATFISNRGYEFMGIVASFKFFVYFWLGYWYVQDVNKLNVSLGKSLLAMAILFVGVYHGDKALWHYQIPKVTIALSLLMNVVYALVGVTLMVAISKQLASNVRLLNNKIYNAFKRDSYDLYLYSDPFNYAIIAVAFSMVGGGILTDNFTVLGLYLARFVLTILLAYVVMLCKRLILKYYNSISHKQYNSLHKNP